MIDVEMMFFMQIPASMSKRSVFGPCKVRSFLDSDGIVWFVESDLVSIGLPYNWEYMEDVWEAFDMSGQYVECVEDILDEIIVDAYINKIDIGKINLQVINRDFVVWLLDFFEISNLGNYLKQQFEKDFEKLIISGKG